MLPPPQNYLQRLRQLCDKHGILLIFDEVITGFGRLGTPFAADFFGVRDRGRLKTGLAADVTIFDPETVASVGRPERRYDLPGGAKRMVMRSQGIEYTIVNGAVTWERGALTEAANGEVLRS